MGRRRSKHTMLPVVLRIAAIAAIAFVCYRFAGAPAADATDASVVADKTIWKSGESDEEIVAAKAPSSSIFSYFRLPYFSAASEPTESSGREELVGNAGQSSGSNQLASPDAGGVANDGQASGTSRFAAKGGGQPLARFANAGFTDQKAVQETAQTAVGGNAADSNLNGSSTGRDNVRGSDGKSAEAIFEAMLATYERASNYRDNGKIQLSYRNDGLLMTEEEPFSTQWNSSRKQYKGKLFRSELVCDGEKLSCFVFDVDTENFGNQQLVVPVNQSVPVTRLYADAIARKFVTGVEDFPLLEREDDSRGGQGELIPPPLALLAGQVSSPWLSRGAGFRRLPDRKLAATDCYVISSGGDSSATLWIDKSNTLLRKIEFPTSLLKPEILQAKAITDVELTAVFENAVVDSAAEPYTIPVYKNARPVSRFVELPQSLASDFIGQSIRGVKFLDRNGERIVEDDFRGKLSTVVWLGDERWVSLVDTLAQFQKALPERFEFFAVYASNLLESDVHDVPRPVESLKRKETAGVPFLFDAGVAMEQLHLKSFPTLLVIDEKSKVQFVQDVSDPEWATNLTAVLKRLDRGDDIAAEMIGQYQKHLQEYDAAIRQFDASRWIPASANGAVAVKSGKELRESLRDRTVRLTPNRKWRQTDFVQPGNVFAFGDETGRGKQDAAFAVLDGYQTIKLLSNQGVIVNEKVLNIPEDQALTSIRKSDARTASFALFGKLGAQVHFFDSDWRRLGSFPNVGDGDGNIQDCQPIESGGSGLGEAAYLIAMSERGGVFKFDMNTGKAKRVSDRSVTSFTIDRDQVASISDGLVVDLAGSGQASGGAKGEYLRILSAGVSGKFLATRRTGPASWSAVGLNSNFQEQWSVDLKSQLSDNAVEPLAFARAANGDLFWAVVDDRRTVCLISDRGTWLGDFQSKTDIRGVALASEGDRIDLIVASEEDVVCWALNYDARN